jgi:superoxide dismutase, Fe-Mn family
MADSTGVSRRDLLAGALGAVAAAGVTGSAFAQMAAAPGAGGAAGGLQSHKAVPLPQKIYKTAENGISAKTHDEHFKLYNGYVNKYHEILTALRELTPDPTKANQTYSAIRELKVELTFAMGGVSNHELYFDILGGDGKPTGKAADAISSAYGSVETWMKDAKATAIAARGWVFTAWDFNNGGVFNFLGDAQNTFPVWNATPFIAIDTYEHAYYLDFQTARGNYVDALFKCLDWSAINKRFEMAVRINDFVTMS